MKNRLTVFFIRPTEACNCQAFVSLQGNIVSQAGRPDEGPKSHGILQFDDGNVIVLLPWCVLGVSYYFLNCNVNVTIVWAFIERCLELVFQLSDDQHLEIKIPLPLQVSRRQGDYFFEHNALQ